LSAAGGLRFLITDHDFPSVDFEVAYLREAGHEAVVGRCRTEEDVIAAAKGCAGAIVQYAPMNAKVFAACPDLRIVSRFGAGFDTVNVADAKRHGVWVANSPDYGVGEVATHALAMALALVRHLPWFDRDIRAGRWDFASTGPLTRPSQLTLGLLGLGRIGKRMAHVARDCFAGVIACDPYLIDGDFPAFVERVDFATLLARSDVLSLHVPLNDETRHLIGAEALAALKPGAFLVNTARGAVADVEAVVTSLEAGRLAAAALDVLPTEPPPPGHRILAHPRILLSPHAAFYSVEGERELRRKAVQNLVEWARTGRPRYVVSEGR
jgi:phosphoglycerate dehydrogenase-like enzyme